MRRDPSDVLELRRARQGLRWTPLSLGSGQRSREAATRSRWLRAAGRRNRTSMTLGGSTSQALLNFCCSRFIAQQNLSELSSKSRGSATNPARDGLNAANRVAAADGGCRGPRRPKREKPCWAGPSGCAEEDSNLHPVIPDQALNLVTRVSYPSASRQIVRIVPTCGRCGRIGRSGCCHGCCQRRSRPGRVVERERDHDAPARVVVPAVAGTNPVAHPPHSMRKRSAAARPRTGRRAAAPGSAVER